MKEEKERKRQIYYLASKIVSVIGLISVGLGVILNKNVYFIGFGTLMVLLGLIWFWKSS